MAKKTTKKTIKAEKKVVKEPVKIEKKIIEPIEPEVKEEIKGKTEKEVLLELYDVLKARKINSISDLENLIANS